MKNKHFLIKILTILLLSAYSGIGYSQPVTWVKVIGDPAKSMTGVSVAQTYDGGFVVLGYRGNVSNDQKMLLIKLDYLGNLQWLKYPIDTTIDVSPLKLVQTKDSGLVMFGYDGNISRNFLVKTDKNGNFLWRKNYPDTAIYARFYDFNKTLDNGFILTGTYHNWNPPIVDIGYVAKTDSAGNRIWHKFFSDSSVTSLNEIIQLPDSCYYLGEATTRAGYPYGFAKKLTKYGDVVWTKFLISGGGAGFPVQVTSNTIAFSSTLNQGYHYVISYIDTASNILWQKTDSFPGQVNSLNSVFNSSIVVTGFVLQGSTIGIRKLSLTNSILFTKSFLHPGYTLIGALSTANTNDNGFIMTGDADINLKYYLLIIKTDSLFNAPLITNISNLNETMSNKFELYSNFPNPFNPITNIKYQIQKTGLVTLKIYDITGREVKTLVNEIKNPGSYIVSFNGTEFASGVYFYRIQAGDFVQVKKMVLIK